MAHQVQRLDLIVTEACNLACPYCFAARRQGKQLTFGQACLAINWLLQSTSPRVHVTLWGGEPLLRLDFLQQLVAHAQTEAASAHKHLSFSLPTNATLLDEATLAWLAANEISIFLSIDGDETTQASRPLARGGNSHTLAARGLAAALAARRSTPPPVRMTVTPEHASRLAQNARYFIARGVHELLIYADLDRPWSAPALEAYRTSQLALAELLLEELRRAGDPRAVVRLAAWRPVLARLARGRTKPRSGPYSHCGAGVELLAVAADGRFSPCHRFVFYARANEFALGDLQGGPDLEPAAALAALRLEELRGEVLCTTCELFDTCTLSCPAICYATTGHLAHFPPWACALMRAQVEACKHVYEELAADPRLALYWGESLQATLHRVAHVLGAQAHHRIGGDHGQNRTE